MSPPGPRPLAIGVSLVVGIAGLAVVGGVVAAEVTGQVHDTSDTDSSAQALLQADLDATLEAGLPADDPKVQMLEEEIAALDALEDAEPVPELEADQLESASGAGQRGATGDSDERWDSGSVACEPLPGLLTADALRGATCRVEPQGDGSVLYIVTFADGNEQAVPFGDGTAQATPLP